MQKSVILLISVVYLGIDQGTTAHHREHKGRNMDAILTTTVDKDGYKIEVWKRDDKNHRGEDKPAYIMYNPAGVIVQQEWWKDGKWHRDGDDPAMVGHRDDGALDYQEWWKDGKRHRDGDDPAVVVYRDDGSVEHEEWWWGGGLHRDADKPAIVKYWRVGVPFIEEWYWSNERHRDEGMPAVIVHREDGGIQHREWWVDGIQVPPPRGTSQSPMVSRSVSPIPDELAAARTEILKDCDSPYPVIVSDSGDSVDVPPPPLNLPAFHALMQCASRVVSSVDANSPRVGRGNYGSVWEFPRLPGTVVKQMNIRPPSKWGWSIPVESFVTTFTQLLNTVDATVQQEIMRYLTHDTPDLSEARIHAFLSGLMGKRDIPPCIPVFIGSYIGMDTMSQENSTWITNYKGNRTLLRDGPALFILMEDLRTRGASSLSALRRATPHLAYPMYVAVLACLATLQTKYAFSHGDLHEGNVLVCNTDAHYLGLRIVQKGTPIAFYRVRMANRLPVILDFGMATIAKKSSRGTVKVYAPDKSFVVHKGDGTYRYHTSTSSLDYAVFGGPQTDVRRLLWGMRAIDAQKADPSHGIHAAPAKPADPFLEFICHHPSVTAICAAGEEGVRADVPPITSAPLGYAKLPVSMILKVVLDGITSGGIPSACVERLVPPIPDDDLMWTYDIHVDASWDWVDHVPSQTRYDIRKR